MKKKPRPFSEPVKNYQVGAAFVDCLGVYVDYRLNVEDARSYQIDVLAWHLKVLS